MPTASALLRRSAALSLAALLTACATAQPVVPTVPEPAPVPVVELPPEPALIAPTTLVQVTTYDAMVDNGFALPAIRTEKFDPKYLRQIVDYPTTYPVGTIVVDPHNRFLHLIEPNGKAMRYGVGVGKAGLDWSGEATVGWKQQWPRWIPTKDMIKRNPERYAQYADGVDGGLSNPLGPRALYLWQNGKDTYYRIHGTTEPSSIGTAASSGCIRMFNQDVIDLYERVPEGSTVVVL